MEKKVNNDDTQDISGVGRKKSKAYPYVAGLGIEENYHQALRSKQCIPKFTRSPPTWGLFYFSVVKYKMWYPDPTLPTSISNLASFLYGHMGSVHIYDLLVHCKYHILTLYIHLIFHSI